MQASKSPTPEHSEALRKAVERARSLLPLTKDWKFDEESDKVKIYVQSDPSTEINIARGECTIAASVDDILNLVWNDEAASYEIDKMKDSGKEIEAFSPNQKLYYHRGKAPSMIVSARDNVMMLGWTKDPDGSILICGCSVVDSRVPENKGIVRANTLLLVRYLKPISENETQVIVFMQMDPMGSVPKAIINKISKDRVKSLGLLRQVCEKRFKKKQDELLKRGQAFRKFWSKWTLQKTMPRKERGVI